MAAEELVFRGLTGLLVLTGLVIGGYYRRRADRSGGELTATDGWFRLLRYAGILVVAFLLAYLFRPSTVAWASLSLPEAVRLAGALLASLTLPLFVWVFRSLGSNVSATSATRTDHELVTSGPYRWVRHPLYTGAFGFWGGISILVANVLLVGLLVPVVLGLLHRTSLEERRLLEEFGGDYEVCMGRTGRYFPQFRRSR